MEAVTDPLRHKLDPVANGSLGEPTFCVPSRHAEMVAAGPWT
jgi:hypothetical protein